VVEGAPLLRAGAYSQVPYYINGLPYECEARCGRFVPNRPLAWLLFPFRPTFWSYLKLQVGR
jgi:hypothetical protein